MDSVIAQSADWCISWHQIMRIEILCVSGCSMVVQEPVRPITWNGTVNLSLVHIRPLFGSQKGQSHSQDLQGKYSFTVGHPSRFVLEHFRIENKLRKSLSIQKMNLEIRNELIILVYILESWEHEDSYACSLGYFTSNLATSWCEEQRGNFHRSSRD